MKFYYLNLVQSTNTSISASSQASGFPVSNLANDFKTIVWSTTGLLTTEWALFDLGTAQTVTDCLVFNSNCQNDTVTVEANSTSDFSSPAFSQSMALDGYTTLTASFTAQAYRYWRVKIGLGSPALRSIGNIFLGTSYQVTQDLDYSEGLKITGTDLSTTQLSYGGQSFSQTRNQYRAIETIFTMYPQNQRDKFKTIETTVGTHKPFYLNLAPNAFPTDPELNEVIQVKYSALPEHDAVGYDAINASGYFFSTDITFNEML